MFGRKRRVGRLLALFLDNEDRWRFVLDIQRITGLGPGTLYPELAGLEREGIVESRWYVDERAPARVARRRQYRLTHKGIEYARNELA